MGLRLLIAIALLLIPGAAAAGIRAVYVAKLRPSMEIKRADNGDMDADLGYGRRLLVRGGEAFIVQERLTGRIVTRLEDLDAAAPAAEPTGYAEPALVPKGAATVRGRAGEGFDWPEPSQRLPSPVFVISRDPALAGLADALSAVFRAQNILFKLDNPESAGFGRHQYRTLLTLGAPLRLHDLELAVAEPLNEPLDPTGLAAEAESRSALVRRLEMDRGEQKRRTRQASISRAFYGEGKLWAITDGGKLFGIAEGGDTLQHHMMRQPVLDGCTSGAPVVLTGKASGGGGWELQRLRDGRWTLERRIAREGDRAVALTCAAGRIVLLTNRRIIEIAGDAVEAVALQKPLEGRGVTSALHVAGDHLFLGRNAGEWGGGMVRIDRRSGAAVGIARSEAGGLCGGPLNTDCDPVHGIATVPWEPTCVAAAVGLQHMLSHGRIAKVCGTEVHQLLARPADPYLDGAELKEAQKGGFGSIAFYGLAAVGDRLLAVGKDSIHRIAADGSDSVQRWPLFKNVEGVLVSFELPEAVLVVTTINGPVSLGGGAPMLVPR